MYGKLFASLYQGTLRGQSNEILVFTNLIAHCDKEGYVDKHFRAIAEETGITVEEVKSAVSVLEQPDPESRSPDHDGRRIVRIDDHRTWGWQVVNFLKYRGIRDEETRRETWRRSQAKRRSGQHPSTPVNTGHPPSTHTDTDTDTEENTPLPPTGGMGGGQSELFANPENSDGIFPAKWQRLSKTDQKTIKVLRNSPVMQTIGAWFNRGAETLWTVAEAAALLRIKPNPAQIAGMGAYYEAVIEPEKNIRRKDLLTLLNNWQGELDRARAFHINHQ